MTIMQIMVLWYLIGVVSYLIFHKLEFKKVQVKDLVDSLIIGVVGLLVSTIAFGTLLEKAMITLVDWYEKIKHKKLF